MNKKTKKKYLFILLIVLFALTLGACTGRRVTTTGWSGITIKEDIVYFSFGPQVYALDLNNGFQKWVYPEEEESGMDFYAAPVFADEENQLILASYNNTIYSVDPDTGQKKWAFVVPKSKNDNEKSRFIASPLVTNQAIFAPSSDNNLYAIDFAGVPLWTFETGDPIWASPTWSEGCQCIYLASMDHFLYAVDPESGSLLWKSEDLGGPVVSQPTVSDNGLILVSTFANEVIALDEKSHQVEWRYNTSDWAWASPVIDGDQVYASDLSGTFYALDLNSGDPLWQTQPGGSIVSAVLVQDDLIYIGTHIEKNTSSLVVVNRDGVIQRNQPINGKLYTSPASDGDTILISPAEAEFNLIALNQSGVQIWGFPPSDK